MESRMHKIALIDYENVGTLENCGLTGYDEIIAFVGAGQRTVRLPSVRTQQDIRIRPVAAVSKNNVDFHIVLELGRPSVSAKATHVCIISNDSGYDGVVASLKSAGFSCERRAADAGRCRGEPSAPPSDEIVGLCRMAVKKRPKSLKSLSNAISSLSGKRRSPARTSRIISELSQRRLIIITDNNIAWQNK